MFFSEKEPVKKEKILNKAKKLCQSSLKLLDDHLLPMATKTEPRVYYLTIKGDVFKTAGQVAKHMGNSAAM